MPQTPKLGLRVFSRTTEDLAVLFGDVIFGEVLGDTSDSNMKKIDDAVAELEEKTVPEGGDAGQVLVRLPGAASGWSTPLATEEYTGDPIEIESFSAGKIIDFEALIGAMANKILELEQEVIELKKKVIG